MGLAKIAECIWAWEFVEMADLQHRHKQMYDRKVQGTCTPYTVQGG